MRCAFASRPRTLDYDAQGAWIARVSSLIFPTKSPTGAWSRGRPAVAEQQERSPHQGEQAKDRQGDLIPPRQTEAVRLPLFSNEPDHRKPAADQCVNGSDGACDGNQMPFGDAVHFDANPVYSVVRGADIGGFALQPILATARAPALGRVGGGVRSDACFERVLIGFRRGIARRWRSVWA